MSAIPFTDRELNRAWRQLSAVSEPIASNSRQNPHRLLLFYAVECGLKYVLLKRQNKTLFDYELIQDTGHDLRGLLKQLRIGSNLSLPDNLQLMPVNQNGINMQRNGGINILHQAWRYGGLCSSPDDQTCENQLQELLKWIKGEIDK
jgi:hypothetical protein